MATENTAAIEELMYDFGCATREELINKAFSILKWAGEEHSAGRTVASIDEAKKTYKVLDVRKLKIPKVSKDTATVPA